MSIQAELTRITNAKAAIKTAIEGKGVTVPDGTLLDGMAALIESIEAGGGGNGIVYTSGTLTFTSSTTCEDYVITHGLGVTPQIFILCGEYGSSEDYALYCYGVISEGLRNLGYKAPKFADFFTNRGKNMNYRISLRGNISITIDESTITIPDLSYGAFVGGLGYSWHAIGGIEA